MTSLRKQFLVDQLKHAAESKNQTHLSLIREIIKEIKVIQLERVEVATDAMIIEVLEKLSEQKQEELMLMQTYLSFARSNTNENQEIE